VKRNKVWREIRLEKKLLRGEIERRWNEENERRRNEKRRGEKGRGEKNRGKKRRGEKGRVEKNRGKKRRGKTDFESWHEAVSCLNDLVLHFVDINITVNTASPLL
jgi:hypothetical protein